MAPKKCIESGPRCQSKCCIRDNHGESRLAASRTPRIKAICKALINKTHLRKVLAEGPKDQWFRDDMIAIIRKNGCRQEENSSLTPLLESIAGFFRL